MSRGLDCPYLIKLTVDKNDLLKATSLQFSPFLCPKKSADENFTTQLTLPSKIENYFFEFENKINFSLINYFSIKIPFYLIPVT
jgi:hypothetical protein